MGTLVFQATLGGSVNLIGPNTASTINFTLPSADGSSGQALTTNGSGTLAFSTVTTGAAGSTTQVQYNSSGAFAGSANLTFNGTTLTAANTSITTSETLSYGTANGVTYLNGSKVLTSGSALTFDGTNLATTGRISTGAALAGLFNTATGAYLQWNYNGTVNGYIGTANQSIAGGSSTDFGISSAGASSSLVFAQNAIEGMRLTSTGLGIGTSSPAAKLDVVGAINATKNQSSLNLTSSSGQSGFATIVNSGGVTYVGVEGTGAGASFSGASANASIVGSGNTNPLQFITNATVRATLDNSGNLGIGTTSPLGRLHIETTSGSAAFFINSPSATDVGSYISLRKAGSAKFLMGVESTLGGTSDNGLLYVYGANALTMYTNGSERARISSSGDFLVGTTSSSGKATINAGANSNGVFVINDTYDYQTLSLWNKAGANDNLFARFFTESSITLRGSITYNRAGGLTAYNVTSDYRAKDISGPVTNSGALIDSVPVYMGKMKGATQERPMFIAHETPAYAHTGEKDAVDADGNPVYQQMDASALIPVMWAEIQSLRQRVAQLETN